jgi:phosphohistidine phosphatase
MEVYLMQHAEALPEQEDPERSLSPKGEKDATQAGKALARLSINFSRIITSPKKRAIQTAKCVAREVNFPEERIEIFPGLEPLARPEELASQLAQMDLAGPTLLVGHLPSLGDLVSYLMASTGKLSFRMAGIGCMEVLEWKRGGANMLWYLAPEHLALIAKTETE